MCLTGRICSLAMCCSRLLSQTCQRGTLCRLTCHQIPKRSLQDSRGRESLPLALQQRHTFQRCISSRQCSLPLLRKSQRCNPHMNRWIGRLPGTNMSPLDTAYMNSRRPRWWHLKMCPARTAGTPPLHPAPITQSNSKKMLANQRKSPSTDLV